MPTFTVNTGAPEIENGTYVLMLVDIKGDPEDPNKPKRITSTRGPTAGEEFDIWEWAFVISEPGNKYDQTPIDESTSTSSGPRSKMYGWLTALNNGRAPGVGQQFANADLVGRLALGTIEKDENGWPRIKNLSALPASLAGQRLAQETGAPTNQPVPTAQPVREAVAAGAATDDLPF